MGTRDRTGEKKERRKAHLAALACRRAFSRRKAERLIAIATGLEALASDARLTDHKNRHVRHKLARKLLALQQQETPPCQ